VENAHTAPPGKHRANNTTNVKNVVRIPEAIKFTRVTLFWPLHSIKHGSSSVQCASNAKNQEGEVANEVVFHKELSV